MAINIDELREALDITPIEREGPLEDGTKIAYLRFPAVTDPPGTTQVNMKGQPTRDLRACART